jgi:hypothetical protein
MIIDGVSNDLLKDALVRAYQDLEARRPPDQFEAVPYSAWLRDVNESMERQRARDVEFWKNLHWSAIAGLHDPDRGRGTQVPLPVGFDLTQAQTDALVQINGRDGQALFTESVIASLIHALMPWLAGDLVLMEMVVNNRQSTIGRVDPDGLVGNLTTNNVIPVDTGRIADVLSTPGLLELKRQRRAVPNEGRGLLHWLYSGDALPGVVYRPLIGMNLGFDDGMMMPLDDKPSPWYSRNFVRDESHPNIHPLFFSIVVYKNGMRVNSYRNAERCSDKLQREITARVAGALKALPALETASRRASRDREEETVCE